MSASMSQHPNVASTQCLRESSPEPIVAGASARVSESVTESEVTTGEVHRGHPVLGLHAAWRTEAAGTGGAGDDPSKGDGSDVGGRSAPSVVHPSTERVALTGHSTEAATPTHKADGCVPKDPSFGVLDQTSTEPMSAAVVVGSELRSMPSGVITSNEETDEQIARRLTQELNASGRRRRTPAPVYVPASTSLHGAKAEVNKATWIPRSTRKADADADPYDFDDGELDEDGAEEDPNTPPQVRPKRRVSHSDSPPARELPPPQGFAAGTIVWALLPRASKHAEEVWWPGRVWKLRHCVRKEALWARRGAPPAERRALVRCFGDGSFTWCAADELTPYTGDAATRRRRAAELVSHTSLAGGRSHKKKRRSGSLKFTARMVNKALLEAEEAELTTFHPPWSDSEVELCSDDDERPLADAFGIITAAAKSEPAPDARKAIGAGGGANGGSGSAAAVDGDQMKDGLTPDWIVDAGCRIFNLNLPTVDDPIIRGLLDPCTNNKRDPNIPAEKTYDREDDGLKQENSWKGYYIILNPSYESQVQWRFINRAINEVEWGFCPGVLLVCRNSTDTSYFQRLLPFPRIFLRRDAIHFKDYDHTPIGFGIAVFCLVSPQVPKSRKIEMYTRFYDEFHHAGEFNVPFDRTFLTTPQFKELTDRLHVVAAERHRDSWVACDKCNRWREIPTSSLAVVGARTSWKCKELYPAMGCTAPLTKREFKAFSVARKGQAVVLLAEKPGETGTDVLCPTTLPPMPVPLALPSASTSTDDVQQDAHYSAAVSLPDSPGGGESKICGMVSDAWGRAAVWADPFSPAAPDPDGTMTGTTPLYPRDTRPEDEAQGNEGEEQEDKGKKMDSDGWLDEVQLRGGRRRFKFEDDPISHKPKRPECIPLLSPSPLQPPMRGTTHDIRNETEGELPEIERERLARVKRNQEFFLRLSLFQKKEKELTPQDIAAEALRKAAEASASLNAARRILNSAEEKHSRAALAAHLALKHSQKAAAAANIASAQLLSADAAAEETLEEVTRAREVVDRLSTDAAAANEACNAADEAAKKKRKRSRGGGDDGDGC